MGGKKGRGEIIGEGDEKGIDEERGREGEGVRKGYELKGAEKEVHMRE